ncbi:hypothetical protein GXB81_18930 [Paraburkholderia sp. Ac-20336]|uniref:hypothetical protein n=1 Tax=Paraburkholderia sp. Ac-20336 TaxID=2703886 RepID=UPI00198259C0|nr:hypothetical protein [Paraburkholderia sp. Ac-20336]MBN3805108.1 hypothetical protein [Paraburkholderia sp. Ac-20336]
MSDATRAYRGIAALQSLTVACSASAYDGFLRFARDGHAMNYPYDMLTATCLFIIVVSSLILLALS